jgi:hypothetical protein
MAWLDRNMDRVVAVALGLSAVVAFMDLVVWMP